MYSWEKKIKKKIKVHKINIDDEFFSESNIAFDENCTLCNSLWIK